MSPGEQAAYAFRSWLETEEGLNYTARMVSRHLGNRLRKGSFPATFSGERFSPDPAELPQEVTQEFLAFLFTSFLPKLHKKVDQVNMILGGQMNKVLHFALNRFFWDLDDSARKKDVNPRGYLHRRIRELLSDDQNFIVKKDASNFPVYFPSEYADTILEDASVFSSMDYSGFPVPPELGSNRDTLFTAAYLSRAAAVFWQEVARQSAGHYAVPVRELVRYLAARLSWINRLGPESLDDVAELPGNIVPPEEQFERTADLASIAALAVQFAEGMDRASCRILVWRLEDPPISFQEIARRLDLTDHNRPYRVHRKTCAALQKFTANWPGPPLAELPEEVGLTFIEALVKICKKSVC